MIKLLSNLLQRIGVVQAETTPLANSAPRIGALLNDLAKAGVFPYDAAVAYEPDQYLLYKKVLTRVALATTPGQTPESHSQKFDPLVIINADQISNNSLLPVASSAMAQVIKSFENYATGSVPVADETTLGKVRKSTDKEVIDGTKVLAFVTPDQLGDVLDKTSEAHLVKVLSNPAADTKTLLCAIVAACGGGTGPITPPAGKTIIGLVGIDAPDAIDEGVLTTQVLAIVTYNDGTGGKLIPSDANGFKRSIINGQGEQISATGIIPIYSNQVTGDSRDFVVQLAYRLPGATSDTIVTKKIHINDKSTSQDIMLGELLMPFYVDNSATAHDYYGLYDGIDCANGVRGWALDFLHSDQSVTLEILRDGVVAGEAKATKTRSDVSDAFGITNSNGHVYGYQWLIPDNLKDSLAHKYSARFKGTTVLVSGDPVTLTCLPPDNAACPNLALMSTGGTASASSTYPTDSNAFAPANAFNGDRTGVRWGSDTAGTGSGWNNATANTFPQWLARDFGQTRSIQEFEIVGFQGDGVTPVDPNDQTSGGYPLIDFDVQYLLNGTWVTVPGGAIRGNNKIVRRIRMAQPLAMAQFRVYILNSTYLYARVVEVIARGCPTGPVDSPTTIKITNAPAHQNEGTGLDLVGEISYADGRVDLATPANSTYQIATAAGDYDVATGTHAATAAGATLGNNGHFTVATNNVRGDGRTVRIKLSAYGLSDTATVVIDDTTPAPTGSITQIGRAFVGTGGPSGASVRDILYFVKNGVMPTGATGEGPVYGYRNVNTSTGNLDAGNEMYSVDGYPYPVHWTDAFNAAKAAGYKWFAYANIGDAGQTVRFRFRGKASLPTTENQDFDFVGPADGVNVALSTIYPAQ